MNTRNYTCLIACLWLIGLAGNLKVMAQTGEKGGRDPEIEALISKMSIEEKVGQMTQINIDVISQGEIYNLVEPHTLDSVKLDSAVNHYYVGSVLNAGGHTYTLPHWREIISAIQEKAVKEGNHIPILYGIDAIHGVNYTVGATLFPQEIGQAATWNPELVELAASVTAYECRASGIPWNFSPVLDLGRQPLWSRFFETYGEDVHLACSMARACVRGYQGEDPSQPDKVAACLKHFLGYSMPLSGKDRTPAWIPERQLREYFLPTFQEAIDQGALTIMINSGEVNGIPVHASHEILTGLLREELGFEGVALTDWEDIIKLYRDHKVASDMREAVKMAVLAGVDMSMTPNDYSFNHALIDLVKTGEIPESRLDESCRRILTVKKKLGILSSPIPDFSLFAEFASDKHKNIARNTAGESITLLKNEGGVLPLDRNSKVLVCGPAANSLNILNGAWTHTWQGVDTAFNTEGALTIWEAMQKRAPGQVFYTPGCGLSESGDMAELMKMAAQADVILVCLGELPSTEKPGDIESLELPGAQHQMVLALAETGKPLVLTFTFNRPLIVRDVEPLAQGILHTYLPGDYGGEALADILYGEVNPSGKLPFTYPRYTGSIIPYDHKYTERLDKKFGQQGFNPQWEFGFGLSYSKFLVSDLRLNKDVYSGEDEIELSFSIENVSARPGAEVIQVWVSDRVASITPSVKRLRAFQKIRLDAGEKRMVTLRIPISELAFVGLDNQWIIEPGQFDLVVGSESVTFELQ